MVWKPGPSGSEAWAVADSQRTQTSAPPRHSRTLAAGTRSQLQLLLLSLPPQGKSLVQG